MDEAIKIIRTADLDNQLALVLMMDGKEIPFLLQPNTMRDLMRAVRAFHADQTFSRSETTSHLELTLAYPGIVQSQAPENRSSPEISLLLTTLEYGDVSLEADDQSLQMLAKAIQQVLFARSGSGTKQ